jgi:hypothetical protein
MLIFPIRLRLARELKPVPDGRAEHKANRMTDDSDSVVAREQSFQATQKYLPPESHRIGTVAPWGRYWMSGLESTLDEPVCHGGCIFPPVMFSPPHWSDGLGDSGRESCTPRIGRGRGVGK